MWAQEPNTNP
ncbi:hypothetical protein FWK35_00030563, partial [Aphis craccivora]